METIVHSVLKFHFDRTCFRREVSATVSNADTISPLTAFKRTIKTVNFSDFLNFT